MTAKGLTDTNPKIDPAPTSNIEKDPDDWVSGDDPMTGAQASYLKTLSEECGEAARALLDGDDDQFRTEITQVAAVAVAILESLPAI